MTAEVTPISNDAALRLGLMTLISSLEVQIGTRYEIDLPPVDERVRAGIRLGHAAGERSAKASMVSELRNLLAATR